MNPLDLVAFVLIVGGGLLLAHGIRNFDRIESGIVVYPIPLLIGLLLFAILHLRIV